MFHRCRFLELPGLMNIQKKLTFFSYKNETLEIVIKNFLVSSKINRFIVQHFKNYQILEPGTTEFHCHKQFNALTKFPQMPFSRIIDRERLYFITFRKLKE